MPQKELAKTYEPVSVEEKLYTFWQENNYFSAQVDHSKKPFTIVIPPPNVTGQLHMGHALDNTFQDILIRYKRMAGYSALWVPGTDHAGIATQIKVEEYLRIEENITKYDLGREQFLKRVWEWKEKFGSRIVLQLQKLGCSCDWSRLRFTMDEGCSRAVREVFVNLYEKGLIYRGYRIINWCPSCLTALSDAEVSYEEKDGHFWHIKYMVKDSNEYVVIATTRPETMLGDTAVAVHPEDERYAHLVGKTLVLPLVGREIPVIADEYVEKDFGTGVVKITPAHDPNDFEVGKRHQLEQIKVMNDDATINEHGGKYKGMDRYEARRAIVADLQSQGLLVKTQDHQHNVGQCYRCSTVVEPLTSNQWFVKMKPLAEPAMDVVRDGRVAFVPDKFSKIYMNWMENVLDWCISRQLWWGHRIPAFYCKSCGHMEVSKTDMDTCPVCKGPMVQDEDVLDTWFSSALWPFSTLGWPDKTEDFNFFYPTSVLVTAYDIIFFWVARMIFSGLEHTGKEPFKHVFIHGIIRDAQGKKMSKSLGNGIDPLEIINLYGADALRHALATGNSPGNDMRFSMERVEASRNFANKLWNAARFVLMNLEDHHCDSLPNTDKLMLEDKWILNKYNHLVTAVTDNLEGFELGMAISKLYDFIWDDLCDWYIELIKPRLYNAQREDCADAKSVIVYVLSNTLSLLHPFMPYITEEIWQSLPHHGDSIMVSNWPKYRMDLEFQKEQDEMEMLMLAIKAVRGVRADKNVPPSKKAAIIIVTEHQALFEMGRPFFEKLAYASEITVCSERNIPENAVSVVTKGAEIVIPLDELINKEEELAKLQKEKQRLEGEVKRVDGKLGNAGFMEKAPSVLIEQEKQKRISYVEMLEKVNHSIKSLR